MSAKINNVLYLVGGTCTGKTALARKLEERGFTWIRSITTRRPRPGERDEYKGWVSPTEFYGMEQAGELDYIRDYVTHDDLWRYAFLRKDLRFDPTKRYVMIGDPVSAKRALNEFKNVLMLMAMSDTIYERLESRGWSEEFIHQRIVKDDEDFGSLMRFVQRHSSNLFWVWNPPVRESGPPYDMMAFSNDFEGDIPEIIDYIERRIPRP